MKVSSLVPVVYDRDLKLKLLYHYFPYRVQEGPGQSGMWIEHLLWNVWESEAGYIWSQHSPSRSVKAEIYQPDIVCRQSTYTDNRFLGFLGNTVYVNSFSSSLHWNYCTFITHSDNRQIYLLCVNKCTTLHGSSVNVISINTPVLYQ